MDSKFKNNAEGAGHRAQDTTQCCASYLVSCSFLKKATTLITLIAFLLTSVPVSCAQTWNLPAPGVMLGVTSAFAPVALKGMRIYPDQPVKFDFIIDTGDAPLSGNLKAEISKLIRYFLAALTTPEDDLWVNLSPYEGDRIIPEAFGQTEMGRDLLAQDYILKQITASIIYPEGEVGKRFWSKVYREFQEAYGTTDFPVDTFNKVWITPDEATVYVNGNTAVVKSSRLKVLLESDYLAAQKQRAGSEGQGAENNGNSLLHAPGSMPDVSDSQELAKNVLREVVIPILEKEVNEGANFAVLRQIYHAMVLAAWFKRNLKESLVGRLYADQNKVKGIDWAEKGMKDQIWKQYVAAFKKGAFNYIKEETDELTGELIPRKYFSGGFEGFKANRRAMNQIAASFPEMARAVESAMGKNIVIEMKLDPASPAMGEGQPSRSEGFSGKDKISAEEISGQVRDSLRYFESVVRLQNNDMERGVLRNLQQAEKDGFIEINYEKGTISLLPIPAQNLPEFLEHFGEDRSPQSPVFGNAHPAAPFYLKLPKTLILTNSGAGKMYKISTRELGEARIIYIDPESIARREGGRVIELGNENDLEYGRTFIVLGGVPRSAIKDQRDREPRDEINADQIAVFNGAVAGPLERVMTAESAMQTSSPGPEGMRLAKERELINRHVRALNNPARLFEFGGYVYRLVARMTDSGEVAADIIREARGPESLDLAGEGEGRRGKEKKPRVWRKVFFYAVSDEGIRDVGLYLDGAPDGFPRERLSKVTGFWVWIIRQLVSMLPAGGRFQSEIENEEVRKTLVSSLSLNGGELYFTYPRDLKKPLKERKVFRVVDGEPVSPQEIRADDVFLATPFGRLHSLHLGLDDVHLEYFIEGEMVRGARVLMRMLEREANRKEMKESGSAVPAIKPILVGYKKGSATAERAMKQRIHDAIARPVPVGRLWQYYDRVMTSAVQGILRGVKARNIPADRQFRRIWGVLVKARKNAARLAYRKGNRQEATILADINQAEEDRMEGSIEGTTPEFEDSWRVTSPESVAGEPQDLDDLTEDEKAVSQQIKRVLEGEGGLLNEPGAHIDTHEWRLKNVLYDGTSYEQRVHWYDTNNLTYRGYAISHAQNGEVPGIMRRLGELWARMSDARFDWAETLAEFEWLYFQANVLGRSGASIGITLSAVAQMLHTPGRVPLHDYRRLDARALGMSLKVYKNQRVAELKRLESVSSENNGAKESFVQKRPLKIDIALDPRDDHAFVARIQDILRPLREVVVKIASPDLDQRSETERLEIFDEIKEALVAQDGRNLAEYLRNIFAPIISDDRQDFAAALGRTILGHVIWVRGEDGVSHAIGNDWDIVNKISGLSFGIQLVDTETSGLDGESLQRYIVQEKLMTIQSMVPNARILRDKFFPFLDALLPANKVTLALSGGQDVYFVDPRGVGTASQTTSSDFDKGGIDLNSKELNISETGDKVVLGAGVDPAMFARGVDGFVPVILNIVPLNDPWAFFASNVSGGAP